jgi:hypothetical protein
MCVSEVVESNNVIEESIDQSRNIGEGRRRTGREVTREK